jgi:hypothetical protein
VMTCGLSTSRFCVLCGYAQQTCGSRARPRDIAAPRLGTGSVRVDGLLSVVDVAVRAHGGQHLPPENQSV